MYLYKCVNVLYECVYVFVWIRACVSINVHMNSYGFVYICMDWYVYLYGCVYVFVWICICICITL